jgi:hypothetical protein
MMVNAKSIKAMGCNAGMAAAGITVIVDVLLSFNEFVSGSDIVTVAVLETIPGAGGRVSTSEIVAEPELPIVPNEQVTVEVPLQLP